MINLLLVSISFGRHAIYSSFWLAFVIFEACVIHPGPTPPGPPPHPICTEIFYLFGSQDRIDAVV